MYKTTEGWDEHLKIQQLLVSLEKNNLKLMFIPGCFQQMKLLSSDEWYPKF